MSLRLIPCAMVGAASFVGASAHGSLAFSFSDPVNGRQVTHTQANQAGAGTGVMSYDQTAILGLFVDGTGEANPFTQMFSNARMEMSMTVFTGTTAGGVFSAPVSGYFRIYDASSGLDIVRGDATGGAFLRVAGTSSLLLSSDNGFAYTFGAELLALLASSGNGGSGPVDPQEAVFTITDALATGGGGIVGTGGVVKSFTANASYSGNVDTVPAPGALALLGLAGVVCGRRRRA
ncbi:MAG: PEP-CTERM sorting domain-containing protein [bacterium]